jgi:hypothetical protein
MTQRMQCLTRGTGYFFGAIFGLGCSSTPVDRVDPVEPGGAGTSLRSGGATSSQTTSAGAPADGGSCAANAPSTQAAFVDLAPPEGAPLNPLLGDPIPAPSGSLFPPSPPSGWTFYQASGAVCRDGSPAGFYVRFTSSDKLVIYLEGGGACDSAHFCDHNPANLNQVFPGGDASQGQTIGGSLFVVAGLQQPYTTGIFDASNPTNPFQNWNQVYVPYCTGDVHFGTKTNVSIPWMTQPQQFVGYLNMQKFVGRLMPTFTSLSQIVLTGASAGGFGAGLNAGMVQDAFPKVPVTVLDDSGPPFSAQYLPGCLQKEWRDTFGFDAALPSDCVECRNADGSGLTDIVKYWHRKYPSMRVGLVSTMQDEVMRLFFAQGDNACATNDPNLLVFSPYPADQYTAGLNNLRSTWDCTGVFSSYYIAGPNPTYHQHIFRPEFFQVMSGNMTIAAWAAGLVNGTVFDIGP